MVARGTIILIVRYIPKLSRIVHLETAFIAFFILFLPPRRWCTVLLI